MKRLPPFILLILCLPTLVLAHPQKVIIFDLGNVLVEVSRFRFARHVGIGSFLWYSIMDKKNPLALKDKVYDVLNRTRDSQVVIDTHGAPVIVVDDKGNPLPTLLCEHQAGIKTAKELVEETQKTINQLHQQGYFSSERERALIEKTIKTIFDPQVTSHFIKPINQTLNLLKKYAKQCDQDGSPSYEIFILSNWAPESFAVFKESTHGQKILQHVKPENVIISGQFHDLRGLKPHSWVFDYTLQRIEQRGFHRSNCIFIDDQRVNVESARASGLQAYQFQNGNFKELEAEVQRFIMQRPTIDPLSSQIHQEAIVKAKEIA